MTEWRRAIVWLACMAVLLAGCGGGSGSTGLISSEAEVIDEVRRDGTCGEFDGAPYCATDSTDATAPGGQSASIVTVAPPTPVRTPTPSAQPSASPAGPTETPTFDVAPTSTPMGAVPTPTASPGAGGATPTDGGGNPTPQRTHTPMRTATVLNTGTPGARTATPAAGATSTPTPQSTAGGATVVVAVIDGFDPGAACSVAARPAASGDSWRTGALVALGPPGQPVAFPIPNVPSPRDLALICFETPPAALPSELGTLSDANPTVVFVLPSD